MSDVVTFTKGAPLTREQLRAVLGDEVMRLADEGDLANQPRMPLGCVTVAGIDRNAGLVTCKFTPEPTLRIRNLNRREAAEAALEGRDMTVADTMLNGRPNRHERRKAARVNLPRKDRVAR